MPYSNAVKEKTKNFIKLYGKGVANAIANTGLFFPAVVGQSAFESGYGERIPEGSNNFGGIKYNPNLKGVVGYVTSDTLEYIKGKPVRVKQNFAKFKDVESGFKAHIEVLLKDRYKNARLNAKTPEEQIMMIVQSGYSTTPPQKYLSSMKGIIEATRDLTGLGRISKNVSTTSSNSNQNLSEYVLNKIFN
jgi:flagellum-specific peptidoglycan hydrolase FlgJ